MTTAPATRESAVRAIAGAIADRTAFVATVPPRMLHTVAEALADVPDWTVYLDAGLDIVLRCAVDPSRTAALIGLAAFTGVPMTAVVTVPKTVPAEQLGAALGTDVPTDGSRDVLILGETDDTPIVWPLLFVDALARVDPAAAAQLCATAATTPN